MFIRYLVLFLVFFHISIASNIRIAVAANVSYVMDELIEEFTKNNPDIRVNIVLGGSGKLVAQIRNGAPYDMLLSADMIYPNSLYADGLATSKPRVYARGSLAIFSIKERDFSAGINMLTDVTIDRIAIANPKTAPYGKATVEALRNAGIYEHIQNRLVYAESISQTVSYAMTAADIGIINKSALYSSKMSRYKRTIHWLQVPTSLYTPIEQGVVILKKAKNKHDTEAFYDFLQSSRARVIFQRYGYELP